jgi:hypothetical protein
MPIEKVFAINASPRVIFDAIERDLADASEHAGATHEVLARDPERSIDLRVTIGGMPCKLRYDLAERDGHTEITGTLQPFGWRYAAFRTITFGLRDSNFALMLVQALANLKAEAEAAAARE